VKVLIIAGEASGDLHGGGLVRCLKQRRPNLEIFGIGGEHMAKAGMELIFHIDQLSFLGLWEVVRHLPFVHKVFRRMVREVKGRRPDVVVLIDYPGFNLRFAKALKPLDCKIFYYIAPQVWAWGKRRIKKMAKIIDKLAVIFEFEVPLFQNAGIDVEFVGHPLLDTITTKLEKSTFFRQIQLDSTKPLLALLPGSRNQEVDKLLPPLLESAHSLYQKHPEVQIVVACAPTVAKEYYHHYVSEYPNVVLAENSTYDVMAYSDAAIVASGTATLEVAWFGTPFALVYKVAGLSYFWGKRMIRIPNIGLVNVVAGKRIVPELLQNDVSTRNLTAIMETCIFDEVERQVMITELKKVRDSLGQRGAASRVADLVLSFL
jgi:lipid-A-disaccharide synthase